MIRDQDGSRVRAVVVDDHQLLAQSLSIALGLKGVACVVAPLADREGLVRWVTECAPDLVLLDLDLGAPIGDGSSLVRPFVDAGCRVLTVTASTDQEQVCRAIEHGAVGMVSKSVPFDDLLATALAAARGEEVMSEAERHRLLGEMCARRDQRASSLAPFRRLTAREAQVLRSLVDGLSVTTIARHYYVSEATVRSQVRGVLTKLGVTSQLEAVAAAHRAGWLSAS